MIRMALNAARMALVALAAGSLCACARSTFFVANAPAYFGGYRRVADLPYGTSPRMKLDVYAPKPDSERGRGLRPVVVFFYGGSWTAGNKADYRFVGAALASRGYVAVLPDYRLYPAVRFPEFVNDAANAVAWVQSHAAEYGGDPSRLVLMGHSAGAHMAALLALNDRYLVSAGVKPASIVGFVGLSGPYALAPNSDTLRATFAAPYTPADWQPVQFVSNHSPPALLLHGDHDTVVNVAHAEKLRDALESHGIAVETHLYPDRGHADTVASFAWITRHRTPALEQTMGFLGRVTAQSGPSR